MAESAPNGIVYFHYAMSPYGRRVAWYLAFRKIAYAECIQPPIMPRPDQAALGVRYRRSPTMAIGRDVYLDTRLMIQHLDQMFPASDEHPGFNTPATAGLASLLQKFTVDASLFFSGVSIIPTESPAFKNEAFIKDRAGFFTGTSMTASLQERRPQGLIHTRQCFDIVESLFNDGRKWVGSTEKPTLADLEGVWSIDWILRDLQPPKEFFGESLYPKLYDWRNRFLQELDSARASAPKPVELKGRDAVTAILEADFTDKDLFVDPADPFQLKEGTNVELYPTDGGGYGPYKDRGRLIKLTRDEVAIAVESEDKQKEVHIHAPRWNFKIMPLDGSRL